LGNLDGTDSEGKFDVVIPITTTFCARLVIPITTALCEIGWNFNELRQAVASHRHHSNPPAGGSAGGPAVQGLKKAKRKEKMKAKKEKKHTHTGFSPSGPRPPPALTLTLLTNALCTSKHP